MLLARYPLLHGPILRRTVTTGLSAHAPACLHGVSSAFWEWLPHLLRVARRSLLSLDHPSRDSVFLPVPLNVLNATSTAYGSFSGIVVYSVPSLSEDTGVVSGLQFCPRQPCTSSGQSHSQGDSVYLERTRQLPLRRAVSFCSRS